MVRIGPNEISFANIEVVKDIYGQNTEFMKAPIYDTFSVPPLGIFSMRDKATHSKRRRLLSHVFSQSNLLETEPLVREVIRRLVRRVGDSPELPLDMLSLFRRAAFDIVGELFLGQSFGGLDSTKQPDFLADMESFFINSGIQGGYRWIHKFLEILPVPAIRHFLTARDRIIGYGRNAFESYIDHYGRDSGRKDLLTKFITVKSDVGDDPLSDQEIYTEIANLVFAGTDTTSTTLTYLFWELAKHPQLQARLRGELRSTNDSYSDGIPEFKDIQNCSLLDACINEALRLHPAAPASLQRETPSGGKMMNGVFIPEKTVVSMQCYTTQRDPDAFNDPEAFTPERWMTANGSTPGMKALFMPYSQGTRACLGKNLAQMELKLITSSLIGMYDVRLAPATTEESMRTKDHFLVMPKGRQCNLIFSRVAKE